MRWNGWDAPQPYLVCKLGDPYRSVVCFVQGRGVLNECARVGPVEMERDGVNLLLQRSTPYRGDDRNPYRTIGASVDKGFHPIKSRLIICARRRDEIVSLRFQRVYKLLPQRDTVLRTQVRLRRFIWSRVGRIIARARQTRCEHTRSSQALFSRSLELPCS